MITPGQKLTDGDCFRNGTKDQYIQLLEIERPLHAENKLDALLCVGTTSYDGLYYNGIENLFTSKGGKYKTEYDFPDFKQLCENTFGNG
jgi:hypothetical protein